MRRELLPEPGVQLGVSLLEKQVSFLLYWRLVVTVDSFAQLGLKLVKILGLLDRVKHLCNHEYEARVQSASHQKNQLLLFRAEDS